MLTKLVIRNFKRFDQVEIELGETVVLIGPNNSGKTTALQALALWSIGVRKWNERRGGKDVPEKRPGVTINRRDLISLPVPDANLLWHNLRVRDVRHSADGKQETKNIRVDITVEGVSAGGAWACGLEFDYANEESFYCRPLRRNEEKDPDRMPVPAGAAEVQIAFLPPMSGLAANETRIDSGAINVRLGEGRTAEVLRNLCHQILTGEDGGRRWKQVCDAIDSLFLVTLNEPRYVAERGEILMNYRERSGVQLDLSSAGRGLQQTLLLLAHLAANPGTVLLLDEPDAHLEILRQRQIYQVLTETARGQGSQIIAASHSEVLLNEAADRDIVVAFVGKPHRIDDRGTTARSQVRKALKEIGFADFYQAEQVGWVLYLEGSTDLAILRALARALGHAAAALLERPFVHYEGNQPTRAAEHFFGLREAKPDLVGIAVYDRLDSPPDERPALRQLCWRRREIENYLCQRPVLLAWAEDASRQPHGGDLFVKPWTDAMGETIDEIEHAMKTLKKGSPWSPDTKVTDDFLDPLFASFFGKLGLPNLMRKTDYHVLAAHVPREQIDAEVASVLDAIGEVARSAHPL